MEEHFAFLQLKNGSFHVIIEALWSLIIYYRKFSEKWKKISLETVFHLVCKVK